MCYQQSYVNIRNMILNKIFIIIQFMNNDMIIISINKFFLYEIFFNEIKVFF